MLAFIVALNHEKWFTWIPGNFVRVVLNTSLNSIQPCQTNDARMFEMCPLWWNTFSIFLASLETLSKDSSSSVYILSGLCIYQKLVNKYLCTSDIFGHVHIFSLKSFALAPLLSLCQSQMHLLGGLSVPLFLAAGLNSFICVLSQSWRINLSHWNPFLTEAHRNPLRAVSLLCI